MAGYVGVNLDVELGGKAMDLLTPSGMARLLWQLIYANICKSKRVCISKSVPYDFRLALLSVLRLRPSALGILAPVCSSMGFLAASQSKRSFICPLGSSDYDWLKTGNILAIRHLGFCELF